MATYTGLLLRRAQQAHVALWQSVVSTEITSVQFGVLNTLHERPGSSQRDLCDALDLDRSTIAEIVTRLERRELIERERDENDRRRNVLHLTDRGAHELRALFPRVHGVDVALIGGLAPDDAEHLRELLVRMLDTVDPARATPA